MTQDEWHKFQNLRQWLHTQQHMIKDQKVAGKLIAGDYYTPVEFEDHPGLGDENRRQYIGHLRGLKNSIRKAREAFRGGIVISPGKPFRCWKTKDYAALSEEAFSKAKSNLGHSVSSTVKFSNFQEDFRFSLTNSERYRRRSYAHVHAVISKAYFQCVYARIYTRIGPQPGFVILHASHVGRYTDADAFKVRMVYISGKKLSPDVRTVDQYMVIGEGNAFAVGPTLIQAKRNLVLSVTKKVSARLKASL